jgi:imidazole glycerol-phosphate synthase subunit HisH
MSVVTVVDYGVGNLFSVRHALEKCGAQVQFASTAEQIAAAQRVLLPGVGAFADGMNGLRERKLVDALRDFARSGRPLLGICLGMQMLLSTSEEFGDWEGLDIIPGRVVPIPRTTADGAVHKIPFIGWNQLELPAAVPSWSGTILGDVEPGAAVYLLHSYTALPDDPQHRLADSCYDGSLIAAAIRAGNIYGCQFHPEKSGAVGLRMLSSFVRH